MEKKQNGKKGNKGVGTNKDDFSEWFTQIMLKADLADYSAVSGCIVYKPTAYAIWETIQRETDRRFKTLGIQNAYFPLLIPESLLKKEAAHVEGFVPEVAWVTHTGTKKLNERLAIRPTSETIMYDSYAKWIRSHRDLPLKLNQWNNVVRWEFKHPVPFLRGREFLWNEGHTAFATKKEAEDEGPAVISIYDDVCTNYLALPSLIGKKSKKETFPGAEYTLSMEYFMPNGRAIQGPDWHHDGQNFAKAYGIDFLNKKGKKEFVYQNTFAISTRMLGVMFAVHSDDKGLLLPPMVAPIQVVVVPILFEDSSEKVLKEAGKVKEQLEGVRVKVDRRDDQSPGYKFNEWELRGVPLRIEIGPKDLAEKKVTIARRDTGKKENVAMNDVEKTVKKMLKEIQKELYDRAEKLLKGVIEQVETLAEVKERIENKQLAFAPITNNEEAEEKLKTEITGTKVLNIPEEQPASLKTAKCIITGKKADHYAYIGKSY